MEYYSTEDARLIRDPPYLVNQDGTPYDFAYDVGKGWNEILANAFKQIAEVFDKVGADFSEFSVLQIKEKFGELRIYTGALDAAVADQVYKIIDEAETESCRACEWCGEPGKVRGGGWIKTLCGGCNKQKNGGELK